MTSRFFLLLLCAFLATPMRAQNAASNEVAPVRVEGRRFFDVGPRGPTSGAARAARIERRLRNLIESDAPITPFSPSDVRLRNGEYLVSIGGVRVLSVTRADADDAGQSARELALSQGAALSQAVRDARAARQNPLRGAAILMGQSLRELREMIFSLLPRVFAALLLALCFWILAKYARRMAHNATKRFDFDPNLRALSLALSFYGVWFVGILAILSSLGLDSSSLAAAVGVSGFVLGFAFKDILSHFLAGILLLISGKISIGDHIVVREFEGVIERIELRALELRTDDNRLVIIPNADVFAAPITSNTASPHRRRSFTVTLAPDADIELA
ncbi:MAG: mechanosensitive ion channel, partial [Armatimonadetes bacterium]|nr:mechanosensitive ion channel [Armatimonadota bacterium]